MMKRYILSLLFASFALWLMAVPAMRVRLLITLDDGRTVMATWQSMPKEGLVYSVSLLIYVYISHAKVRFFTF